jgi:hypothetical protein
MGHDDAIALVFTMAGLATMVVAIAHYWYKAHVAKLTAAKPAADVEMRLARLEVAIDDMSAAIGQMTESHRFLTSALTQQRGLPVEVARGSE